MSGRYCFRRHFRVSTPHFAGRSTTSTNQKFQQKNYAFLKCLDIMCESVLHVCVSVCLCMRWLLTFIWAQIAPYTTCLVNGVFWAPGTPRLLTTEQCKQLLPKDFDACQLRYEGVPKLPQRLLAIADISCDLNVCLKIWTNCGAGSKWVQVIVGYV